MRTETAIEQQDMQVELAQVLKFFRERWRTLALYVTVIPAVVTIISLLLPRTYTSSASLLPQNSTALPGSLSGLAGQFGLRVPGDDPTQSPDFYKALIESDGFLRRLVSDTLPDTDGSADATAGTYADLYNLRASTPARRELKAIEHLKKRIAVRLGLKSGIVTVSVSARDPKTALTLTARSVSELETFNLVTRQSQAGAQRRFLEQRLESTRTEVRSSERSLETFLVRNRNYRDSPQLLFEFERLSRELRMREELLINLQQAFEQAKMDEIRNTPVVTIVEAPVLPPKADSRRLALKLIISFVLSMIVVAMTSLTLVQAESAARIRS